jgi:hypothetical protein
MGLHFGPEVSQNIADRNTGGLAQATVGELAQLQCQPVQGLNISQLADTLGQIGQNLPGPLAAHPAGCTFAAALLGEEV